MSVTASFRSSRIYESGSTSPDFKSIEAQIFAAKGEKILSVKELLAKMVEGA